MALQQSQIISHAMPIKNPACAAHRIDLELARTTVVPTTSVTTPDGGGTVWRQSCTSSSWFGEGCVDLCVTGNYTNIDGSSVAANTADIPLTMCSDGSICCGMRNTNCCANKEGYWLVKGQVYAYNSKPGTQTNTAAAASSSTTGSSRGTSTSDSTESKTTPSASFSGTVLSTTPIISASSADPNKPVDLASKIGLGVGLGVGITLILLVGVCLLLLLKRRRATVSTSGGGHDEAEKEHTGYMHDFNPYQAPAYDNNQTNDALRVEHPRAGPFELGGR
ncbi:hypothetical protein EJ08DRAFT_735054 [Tothia fuscella]|uniref:Mid2 domain-containing protein n=1 Tax=Tothia fuscella TaxID=1048955 RepID=A0A9P4NPU2_9PEZI|nr:hypothetical protein EJ08DRAFT_735054 [Tothia fuscella]